MLVIRLREVRPWHGNHLSHRLGSWSWVYSVSPRRSSSSFVLSPSKGRPSVSGRPFCSVGSVSSGSPPTGRAAAIPQTEDPVSPQRCAAWRLVHGEQRRRNCHGRFGGGPACPARGRICGRVARWPCRQLLVGSPRAICAVMCAKYCGFRLLLEAGVIANSSCDTGVLVVSEVK